MYLDVVEERMLSGKEGAGRKKAMEILCAIGDGVGAERMVKITYAHLMPPDVMFFPYGRQGQWAHDMTWELLQDVERFKVPTTIGENICFFKRTNCSLGSGRFLARIECNKWVMPCHFPTSASIKYFVIASLVNGILLVWIKPAPTLYTRRLKSQSD